MNPQHSTSQRSAGRQRPSARKLAGSAIALLLLAGLGGELVARFGLGLGDPPLSLADPDIEYLPKPGTYRRFGNRIAINSHFMRSPERDRFSVLVMGDSVMHGGALTDQQELATTLLAAQLDVAVGNVSADSWGPINLLAYGQKFGFFGADVVVLVLNGPDASDARQWVPVVGEHPRFPTSAPVLALQEGLVRYLPRYLPQFRAQPPQPPRAATTPVERATGSVAPEAIAAIAELVQLGRASGARVAIALHPMRDGDAMPARYAALSQVARETGATVIPLEIPVAGYRDEIHLNALGQAAIADQLRPLVWQWLNEE